MSKIQALLRAFCTVRYIDDPKGGYMFEKYSVALPYKEGDIMLNRSSGKSNLSLMRAHIRLW